MIEHPDWQQLAERLSKAVPQHLKAAKADFDANLRPLMESSLGKLDLVTREEFEVQKAVLARTREKVEALEARHNELVEKARAQQGINKL